MAARFLLFFLSFVLEPGLFASLSWTIVTAEKKKEKNEIHKNC
jgi:hypothetical protein